MTERGGAGVAGDGAVPVLTAFGGAIDALVVGGLAGRRDVVVARRCADVAELVSTAEAGLGRVALVSAGFPQVDAEVVLRLHRAGCAVVGVAEAGAPESLTALGATDLLELPARLEAAAGLDPASVSRLVQAVLTAATLDVTATGSSAGYGEPGRAGRSFAGRGAAEGVDPGTGQRFAGERYLEPVAEVAIGPKPGRGSVTALRPLSGLGPAGDGRTGQLVTVWGPPGSPGRSTVAVTLAAELAALGDEVLLVDADTHASSTAQLLGLLDESAGIVAAARAGAEGRLDAAALARLSPVVLPRLRVLTGIVRGARWPELRPAGVAALWRAARMLVQHVVVDVAAPLEEDEELVYDTVAPRRNGLTLDAVRGADRLLAVGAADPVGLQRLVRALQELAVAAPGVSPRVVANRVRATAVGRRPELRVRDALSRFAGLADVHLIPDDRDAFDRAVLAGRILTEHEPSSPARLALAGLALELRGRAVGPGTQRAAAARGRRGRLAASR